MNSLSPLNTPVKSNHIVLLAAFVTRGEAEGLGLDPSLTRTRRFLSNPGLAVERLIFRVNAEGISDAKRIQVGRYR